MTIIGMCLMDDKQHWFRQWIGVDQAQTNINASILVNVDHDS